MVDNIRDYIPESVDQHRALDRAFETLAKMNLPASPPTDAGASGASGASSASDSSEYSNTSDFSDSGEEGVAPPPPRPPSLRLTAGDVRSLASARCDETLYLARLAKMAIIRGYAPTGIDGLRQAIFLFCFTMDDSSLIFVSIDRWPVAIFIIGDSAPVLVFFGDPSSQ